MVKVPTVKSAGPPSPFKSSKKESTANKLWIVEQCRQGVTQAALCKEFSLNPHTVSGWVKKSRYGFTLGDPCIHCVEVEVASRAHSRRRDMHDTDLADDPQLLTQSHRRHCSSSSEVEGVICLHALLVWRGQC